MRDVHSHQARYVRGGGERRVSLIVARTMHGVAGLAIVGLLMLSTAIAGVSGARAREPHIKAPAYAIEVGHHQQSDGDSWELWIYGNHEGRQCWLTGVRDAGLPSRYETCGYSVPGQRWQLASKGSVGQGKRRESILFFLTRPHLKKLSVLASTKGGHRRIIIPLHTVGSVAARKARLKRSIGYGIVRVKGSIGRITVLTPSGNVVG